MKKIAKIFTMFAVCFVCVLGFTACGKNPIVSASVKSGLVTTIVKNEQVDTDDVVVTLKYKDGTTKDVSADKLDFSTVDTSTAGEKTLKITYKAEDYSLDVTITVVENARELISVSYLESELLTDFETNRDASDEKTQFNDKSQMLLAGQQNTFHFRLFAVGEDEEGKTVRGEAIPEVDTEIKVEILKDAEYKVLSGEALEEYVVVNTVNAKFNFKTKAIGEQFRISVKAKNVSELVVDEKDVEFQAELKVVDAFNVYSAKDLCVYDNAREKGELEDCYDWTEFKTQNGYAGITVNGMVLQARIELTKDDVPAEVFWQEGTDDFNSVVGLNLQGITAKTLAGTPRDRGDLGIYTRLFTDGEEFNFYGNYFAIDTKNFPKMVVDFDILDEKDSTNHFASESASSMMTAHLCLFYSGKLDEQTITKPTSSSWSTIAFYGNGGLDNDKVYENSGGLLMMKNDEINFKTTNTVTNRFYIGYFMQRGEAGNQYVGNYEINNCNGYDSYQCLFYFWGAKNVKIVDSTFKNAGGPAIIADHVYPNKDENYPTGIDIVNSTIESKVTGQEPWFAVYGATSLITNIFALNAGFVGESKGLVTEEKGTGSDSSTHQYINLVLIYKSSSAQSVTGERVHGYTRIFENEEDYNSFYSVDDPQKTVYGFDLDAGNHISGYNYVDVAMSSYDSEKKVGNIYFEDSVTGKYTDAGTIQGSGDPYCATAGNRISAETNYMNVYIFNGMGAILGTYPQGKKS